MYIYPISSGSPHHAAVEFHNSRFQAEAELGVREFRGRELPHRQRLIRSLASDISGSREACTGQYPFQQSHAIQACRLDHHSHLSRQAPWCGCDLYIGIAEDGCEVEAVIAIFNMAGTPSRRTGNSLLPCVMIGSLSGVSSQRAR
jgi:hypothetical protein